MMLSRPGLCGVSLSRAWGCRNLGSNALTGPVPGSWAFGFAQLQQIDLHENQLSEGLPPSWGSGADKMQSLQSLDLSSNTLTGVHPDLVCEAQCGCCEVGADLCLMHRFMML